MTSFIFETFIKLISSAGIFLGFVITLYLLQRLACGLAMRQFGGKVIYLSAIVGTPIHEISHALMCIPFRHKIAEVALFKPDGTGTLGYVNHAYNPHSLWQQIGNFFIGMAPLLGGTLAIYLLTALLLPNHQQIQYAIQSSAGAYEGVLGATSFFTALYSGIKELIIMLFNAAQAKPNAFALWMYLTASISLHLSPSPADMKGSVKGFVLLVPVVAALRVISYSTGEKLFDHIDDALISLSVSYSLCIMLAATMTFVIFAISMLAPKNQ